MFNRQSIHIALLLWGCIFSIIAAICMFMSRNFEKEKRRWMLLMQISSAVLLLSDAFAWGYRGKGGLAGYIMVRISNFLVFFLSDVILGTFHGYVCCCLFGENRKGKENAEDIENIENIKNIEDIEDEGMKQKKATAFIIKAVWGIVMVGVALVIFSQFTGLYYTFDQNNFYHRSSFYVISLLLPMTGMLLDTILIWEYRKNISRRKCVSMLSYIVLPFVAAIVLVFYYGISFINIAISISVILMFVEAMIEQGRKIAQQEHALAEQEKKLAESRIATMVSQIKPHFIYNTLGSIEQLCELNPPAAAQMVHDFAHYLRGNFGELDNAAPIRFSKEIEHTKYYLSIEKVRFPDIEIVFNLKSQDFLIPALSVQPLVENAIKHGVRKLPEGGKIEINCYEDEMYYYVNVKDNGAGFDTATLADRSHIGLRNIKERIRMMCRGTLTITSKTGEGTTVQIRIPKGESE